MINYHGLYIIAYRYCHICAFIIYVLDIYNIIYYLINSVVYNEYGVIINMKDYDLRLN